MFCNMEGKSAIFHNNIAKVLLLDLRYIKATPMSNPYL